MSDKEESESYLFTFLALGLGLLVINKVFLSSKKKKYHSGLKREVFLPKIAATIQHVERLEDGSSHVRPSEGSVDPAENVVNYNDYKPPFYGTKRDFVAQDRRSKKGIAAQKPRTVMEVFEIAVKRSGDKPALVACTGEVRTWSEYHKEVLDCAKALMNMGFQKNDCINILGFNSPEWLVLNNGAIAAGGMAAGVYVTNGTEACEYLADHSEAKIIAVENLKQLDKYIPVADKLTACKAYIVWEKNAPLEAHQSKLPPGVKLLSYDEFISMGKNAGKDIAMELDARLKSVSPGSSCTLIYTSGTTGNPKAVAITHDNCTWTSASTWANLAGDDDLSDIENGVRLLSYLPLSHIAAQMLDVHAPLYLTAFMENYCVLHFADANALKGTLLQSLLKCRPTHFFGVPRVWEKFQAAMMEKGKANGAIKKMISAWARGKGLELMAIREDPSVRPGTKFPPMWGVAKKILSKVREAIGLDQCRVCLVGAAPINRATLEFFFSLDIPVLELYGMSECTGPVTISHLRGKGLTLGSCGVTLPGMEVRIAHVKGRDKTGEGEIQFRGRHIMAGYLKEENKTKDTITEDGWLCSGDVGRLDDKGSLFITGRIKEILIGSGGENVAPVPVEERIKETLKDGVANFVMIGDKRKFFIALVTPKCKPNPDGTFSDALEPSALAIDPACTTSTEACKSEKWRKYIQEGIDDYNKNHAVSNACKIAKYEMLPNDFSVPGGELGPTLKLKRNVVVEKYGDVIEAMYPKE